MKPVVRRTRLGRVLMLWGAMFLVTMLLIAQPTGFSWPFWTYGLVWGGLTSVPQYVFRKFFEEEIELNGNGVSQPSAKGE